MIEWETVGDLGHGSTMRRYAVPGGWLYASRDYYGRESNYVFVPDPVYQRETSKPSQSPIST